MKKQPRFCIGLDVHINKTDYAVRTAKGDIVLEGYCATTYPDLKSILEPYLCSSVVGIESCTAFYPLYDGFKNDDVNVKVANVLQIRQLVAKNDKLDARRLSDMLRLGAFPESFIPPKEIRELRDLVHTRHSFLKDLNKAQSRLWALLTRKGIKSPYRKMFCKKNLVFLQSLIESEKCGKELSMLYTHCTNILSMLNQVNIELDKSIKEHFLEESNKLQELEGIGPIISTYIIAEAFPISRFANEKKLRRYAGVVPCNKESGGKFHGSHLPKTSSRTLLRWALTQAAHVAIRTKKSKLRLYYQSKKKKNKGKAIMAVARCISDTVYTKFSSRSFV
jgi:transposase